MHDIITQTNIWRIRRICRHSPFIQYANMFSLHFCNCACFKKWLESSNMFCISKILIFHGWNRLVGKFWWLHLPQRGNSMLLKTAKLDKFCSFFNLSQKKFQWVIQNSNDFHLTDKIKQELFTLLLFLSFFLKCVLLSKLSIVNCSLSERGGSGSPWTSSKCECQIAYMQISNNDLDEIKSCFFIINNNDKIHKSSQLACVIFL